MRRQDPLLTPSPSRHPPGQARPLRGRGRRRRVRLRVSRASPRRRDRPRPPRRRRPPSRRRRYAPPRPVQDRHGQGGRLLVARRRHEREHERVCARRVVGGVGRRGGARARRQGRGLVGHAAASKDAHGVVRERLFAARPAVAAAAAEAAAAAAAAATQARPLPPPRSVATVAAAVASCPRMRAPLLAVADVAAPVRLSRAPRSSSSSSSPRPSSCPHPTAEQVGAIGQSASRRPRLPRGSRAAARCRTGPTPRRRCGRRSSRACSTEATATRAAVRRRQRSHRSRASPPRPARPPSSRETVRGCEARPSPPRGG